jgi:hypothetical protein
MKLTMEAQFSHMNIRPEKSGEEQGPVAADLKFQAEVPVKNLRHLFRTKVAFETALEGLYDTETKEPKCGDIESIKLRTEGVGMVTTIKTISGESVEFGAGTLNKIMLTPLAGMRASLTFRLQVHPEPEQTGKLQGMLMQSITFDSKGHQQELDLEGGDEEPDGEAGGKGKKKGGEQLEIH